MSFSVGQLSITVQQLVFSLTIHDSLALLKYNLTIEWRVVIALHALAMELFSRGRGDEGSYLPKW